LTQLYADLLWGIRKIAAGPIARLAKGEYQARTLDIKAWLPLSFKIYPIIADLFPAVNGK
jgi:hypothetical protein